MKKRILFIMMVAAAAMLFAVSSASAAFATITSGFQVQNLSSTAANVVITYYNQDGSVDATVNDSIPANSSNTYFPIAASAGFNGSVVISSDQPVAAITNLLGNGTAAGASYESVSAGTAEISAPLITKGNFGYDTSLTVQNTGATAADITVAYANQASCNETATIQPGAAASFSQGSNTCLPSGYVGSATVSVADTANDTIAGTVTQDDGVVLFAYNTFSGGSTNPIMPLVQANNFGFSTGVQIQNVGSTDTSVTVSYAAGSAGTNCTETQTIAAGTSETFALSASCTALSGPQFVGGASVTGNSASQPLAAIVNQLNFSGVGGSAYNAFDPANASSEVVFPLIMQDNFGFFTGFNVYAVGAEAAVTCTFSSGANAPATINTTVGADSAYTAVQTGSGQYVGSATCTSSSGPIVGVANELGSGAGDQFFAYTGFGQ